MYVSTINILWSVVYITGYKEKDKQLNWAHKVQPPPHIFRNWLTRASGKDEGYGRISSRPTCRVVISSYSVRSVVGCHESYAQVGRKMWELNGLTDNAVNIGEETSSNEPHSDLNLEGILLLSEGDCSCKTISTYVVVLLLHFDTVPRNSNLKNLCLIIAELCSSSHIYGKSGCTISYLK
jgi:hypothetical protein